MTIFLSANFNTSNKIQLYLSPATNRKRKKKKKLKNLINLKKSKTKKIERGKHSRLFIYFPRVSPNYAFMAKETNPDNVSIRPQDGTAFLPTRSCNFNMSPPIPWLGDIQLAIFYPWSQLRPLSTSSAPGASRTGHPLLVTNYLQSWKGIDHLFVDISLAVTLVPNEEGKIVRLITFIKWYSRLIFSHKLTFPGQPVVRHEDKGRGLCCLVGGPSCWFMTSPQIPVF